MFESKDALRSRVLAVVGDDIDVHAWTGPQAGQRRIEALTADIDARLRAVVLVIVGLCVRHLTSVETRPYVYFQF